MNKPLNVIAGASDRPLVIGDVEIDCYVLEGEARVLSQRSMLRSLKFARGGPRNQPGSEDDTGAEIPRFATQKWIKPFISNELVSALKSPILFHSRPNVITYGYPATILPDICNAIVDAKISGATTYRQERALATILERFIAKELRPWTKTFPYEFYEEIFRLKRWSGPAGMKRPSVIGHYTNNIVYERLAPGLMDELKRINPPVSPGRRKTHHHRWFTPDIGHPKLKEHLIGVMAIMRGAPNWDSFMRALQRSYPKKNVTFDLDLEDEN